MATPLVFKPSSPDLIGIELECQLVDPVNWDLVDRAQDILDRFAGTPFIKPEFIQNTIEITSPVCHGLDELEDELCRLLADLAQCCHELGIALCAAGTHPFSRRLGLITPLPRYELMEQESGFLSHLQITFATHVHIGMTSGDEAIRLMRELKPYLPLLTALAANSPYWRGFETGYVSYRHRILAAGRSYGIPPSFPDWAAFADFFADCQFAGVFASIQDIHWDIRPQPVCGSLEIRVMDAQSTVADAVILAGLIRQLIAYLREVPPERRPSTLPQAGHWWMEKENRYQASREGLRARFISDERRQVKSLEEIACDVLGLLLEQSLPAPDRQRLEMLEQRLMAEETGYGFQRACFERSGDLSAVVATLSQRLVDI